MAEDNITRLRPFKFPQHKLIQSDFVPSRLEENKAFMEADLAASGLTPDDVGAYVHGKLAVPAGFLGGYVIGYTSPDGDYIVTEDRTIIMYRTKLDPVPGTTPKRKYDQPTAAELQEWDLSGSIPYVPPAYHRLPKGDTLYICEGEKKAACVAKYLQVRTIGIGGCWNWRDGTSLGGVHPWIMEMAEQYEKVIVVPDGDFRRYDIAKAYGTFSAEMALALPDWQGTVEILACPDKIDDLIVQWGPEAEYNFYEIETIQSTELVEDPATLMKRFDLAFKINKEGGATVYQHTSNVQRLIERHPAFPDIWFNTDKFRMYFGDNEIIDGVTSMEIANHIQHNFQMDKVRDTDVNRVIRAVGGAKKRSPFLDFIDAQVWDLEPRLDTWLTEYWGVEDSPYAREVASKFLIASLARMRDPGCQVDWMLITTGGQGVGKSSMPKLLWPDNTVFMLASYRDKDFQMMVNSGLCVVVDEMNSMNKGEVAFWKTAITTSVDHLRPPYGASVQSFARRSIFYGTTNDGIFLEADNGGHRRYKPITVDQLLDFRGLQEAMPQLWAETNHRHKNGESWHVETVPPDMVDYVSIDPVEEALREFLGDVAMGGDRSGYVGEMSDGQSYLCLTYSQIKQGMDEQLMGRTDKNKLQNLIKHLGGAWATNPVAGVTLVRGRCYRFNLEDLMGRLKNDPEG